MVKVNLLKALNMYFVNFNKADCFLLRKRLTAIYFIGTHDEHVSV